MLGEGRLCYRREYLYRRRYDNIVKAYEKATGITINYKIAPRRPGDIDECYANPTKAYEVLGWRAENTIEDMCRDSYNWQLKNPNGYEV